MTDLFAKVVCDTCARAQNEEGLANERGERREVSKRDLLWCMLVCCAGAPHTRIWLASERLQRKSCHIASRGPLLTSQHIPSQIRRARSATIACLSLERIISPQQTSQTTSQQQASHKPAAIATAARINNTIASTTSTTTSASSSTSPASAGPSSTPVRLSLGELFRMNTCAVQDVASLQQSDHLCIWDTTRWPFRYTHHGIVFETGKSGDAIVVAHVWSRIDSFRASQADSSFRLTSLTEFLNGRPLSDMRRVQYNSSLVGNALSKLGEVHRAKSDIPPIVLARCDFLLGLGKGHFSILSLNCEHVALWCKTGVVWSKQLFHKVNTKAPFLPKQYENLLLDLDATVERLRQEHRKRNMELKRLDGKRVYLQLGETKFVKRLGDELYAVHNDPQETDPAFRHQPTAFKLQVDIMAYNCVKVMLTDATTGEFMCSKAKSLKMLTRRSFHRESMFKFEFVWNGELQSRRHRRWYVGAQTRDGLLRTFNTRDHAATFQIVDAAFIDSLSVAIDATAFGAGGGENPVEDDGEDTGEDTGEEEMESLMEEKMMAQVQLNHQQQQRDDGVMVIGGDL